MPKRDRSKDEVLLKEIREEYTRFVQFWKPNWEQGDEDMRALSVDGNIPDVERKARKEHLRPCEHFDIISQYTNRVTNQAALNPVGVKVNPAGEGGDDKTAAIREKRQRQIAYESNAPQARLTAFQAAVDRGIGHWIVRVEYEGYESFNQHICIDRVANPKSVMVDPDAKKADRSDQQKAFYLDKLSWMDFGREYPKAEHKSFNAEHMKGKTIGETNKDAVTVCEYWRVEKTPRRLLLIDQIGRKFEDELREEFPDVKVSEDTVTLNGLTLDILKSRDSEKCKVMQYISNGVEILAAHEWLGTTIPILTVTGREKYENDRLVIESLTRKMRSGQLAYDIAQNAAMENLLTQSSWVVADGQIEGFEQQEWKHPHKARVLRYKAIMDATGDKVVQAPHRESYQSDVQAAELFGQGKQRDVQNAVGMSAVETINRTSKSGIAQERIDQAADINAYHLTESYKNAIAFEGRIIGELLDKIEDSERDVGLRDEDGSYKVEHIAPKVDETGNVYEHPYGRPEGHTVTYSTGPDFESQQAEAKEFASLLVKDGRHPHLEPMAIELANLGPVGTKMKEIAIAALPPNIQKAYQGDKEQQIPPMAQAQIAQLEQQLQMAVQELQAAQLELQTKKYAVDIQAKTEEAKLLVEKAVKEMGHALAMRKIDADLEKAQLASKTTLTKTSMEIESKEDIAGAQMEHQEDLAVGQMVHTSQENEAGRQHEKENQNAD